MRALGVVLIRTAGNSRQRIGQRSLARRERMLLVALTGWGQKQDQQCAREAGFDVHLLKPINRAASSNKKRPSCGGLSN